MDDVTSGMVALGAISNQIEKAMKNESGSSIHLNLHQIPASRFLS